jgi:hypothetical protein
MPSPLMANPPGVGSTEEVAPATRTRIERWAGAFEGCMGQATAEEQAMSAYLEYTCACLATYIVSLCAPTDSATDQEVMLCLSANEASVYGASVQCMNFGPLQVGGL